MMRSIGLVDTEMYGGYELDALGASPRFLAGGIPLRVDSQPSWGDRQEDDAPTISRACCAPSGSRAAVAARSASAQPGFTAADARYLLYLLAHVRDPGQARP